MPRDEQGNIPQRAVGAESRTVIVGEVRERQDQRVYRSRPLTLPAHAVLRTGLGLAVEGAAGPEAAAQFSIDVVGGGSTAAVLPPTEVVHDSRWKDVEVDLSPYAGQTVEFSFISSSNAGTPVWGNPHIVAQSNTPSGGPNVLLISLDTLRADHLGAYGYDRAVSPNLDTFARDAVVFDTAISPSSWTLPAHASLFTGRSPSQHGAVSMGAPPFRGTSLAELAYEAGYRTGGLTDGGFVEAFRGFGQGFESYVSKRTRAGNRIEEALDWMDNAGELPFLLFVHTYQVHSPYRPPLEFATRYLPAGSDAEEVVGRIDSLEKSRQLSAANRDEVVDLYDAEIAYTDSVLGEFFQSLRERGLWEQTLIVVFSDHGEQFWEHHQYGHGVSLYEEEIRVPLIVKPAGRKFAAGRRSALVSLTDVYATIAEAMGWQCESDLESRSFAAQLGLELDAPFDREAVISEVGIRRTSWDPIPPAPRLLSYRTRAWKLVAREPAKTMQFYDLLHDPAERDDVFSIAPQPIEAAAESFREYVDESAAHLFHSERKPDTAPALTREQQEELEALGYFQ